MGAYSGAVRLVGPGCSSCGAVEKVVKFQSVCGSKEFSTNIINEEKTYGGGPNAICAKLMSSDGHEFIVKKIWLALGTIKAMLSGLDRFTKNKTNDVTFREISSQA